MDDAAPFCGGERLVARGGSNGNSFGLEISGSAGIAWASGAAVVDVDASALVLEAHGRVLPGLFAESAAGEAISLGFGVERSEGLVTEGGLSSRVLLGGGGGAVGGFCVSPAVCLRLDESVAPDGDIALAS